MLNVATIARSSLATFALMLVCQVASAFTYEITEAELQQKVSAAMPLEIKKQFYTFVISNPVIDISDSDEDIAVIAQVELLTLSKSAAGNIEFNGKLTYESGMASFFLKDVLIKKIQINGVPDTYLTRVKLPAQLAARKMFATYPVYVINDDSIKSRFAKASLKSVSTKDGKLILSMDVF